MAHVLVVSGQRKWRLGARARVLLVDPRPTRPKLQ